ncbi:MAG: response regulator [Bryobacteraceae bacterium]
MSLILLADDSPHAQRMGERILREEGFEVVSVTDGETALIRLRDTDPDLIMADVFLPHRSGYEICEYVKNHPRHKHTRVVLTAGLLEPIEEEEVRRVGGDAILKKPFEASVLMETIRPLVEAAVFARGLFSEDVPAAQPEPAPAAEVPAPLPAPPVTPEIDPERVRAAITLALDAALPKMIEELTERVLVALGH